MNAPPVELYSIGITHASACAPKDMPREQVEEAANRLHPTRIESDWSISDDPTFSTGDPNPCPCNDHPEERRHWLLVC